MADNILASPTNQEAAPLRYEDEEEIESLIKVKLFFYTDTKALRQRLFSNDEWYPIVKEQYGED